MRSYTLSVLSQLANTGNATIEKEIVAWVNKKLQSASKVSSIKSFQDQSISNAKVVLDLIDSIKPGSINYELISDGTEYEVSQCNEGSVEEDHHQSMHFIVSGKIHKCKIRNFDGT